MSNPTPPLRDGTEDDRQTDPELRRVKQDLEIAREKLRRSPVPSVKAPRPPQNVPLKPEK